MEARRYRKDSLVYKVPYFRQLFFVIPMLASAADVSKW